MHCGYGGWLGVPPDLCRAVGFRELECVPQLLGYTMTFAAA